MVYDATPVTITKKKIQHLIYRTCQAGGSTTVITRAAAISWIQCMVLHASPREASILAAIAQELYDTCDQERIDKWSRGHMKRTVQRIVEMEYL